MPHRYGYPVVAGEVAEDAEACRCFPGSPFLSQSLLAIPGCLDKYRKESFLRI